MFLSDGPIPYTEDLTPPVTPLDLTHTHRGQRGELGVEFPDQGHDLTELFPVRGRQRPSGDLSQRCGHPGKAFGHPGPRPSTRCRPPRPSSRGSRTRGSRTRSSCRARGCRARGGRAFGIDIRRHDWPPPFERTHTPTPGVSAKPNVSSSIAGGRTTNQGQASSSNPTATPQEGARCSGKPASPGTPLTLPAATPR